MRLLPILAGVLFFALPALAGDSGRYAIEPAEEGFVRLDTATGAASHCTKTDGVWHCAAVADERKTFEATIAALTDQVAALNAELTRVKGALTLARAALADAQAAAATPAPTVAAEPAGFAETRMQRFVKMGRVLKGLEAPPSA
jgi:hypothetical protein